MVQNSQNCRNWIRVNWNTVPDKVFLCRRARWCSGNSDEIKMAANVSFVYQCSDCKRFYEDLQVFNGHKCVNEGDPIAMLTQIQNEQLEVVEDIEEDKRRTMFTCDDCGSWFLSTQKYKEHACCKKAQEEEVNNNSNGKNEDNEGSGKSTNTSWGKAATLLLIEEYNTKSKFVDKGRMTKKSMWVEISKTINERGYSYNNDQVSGRWKSLMRAYKNVKDHNNKSGNNKKSFEYESQMDDLFGDDPTIKPVVTASSRKRTQPEENENENESLNDGAEPGPSNPKRQKNKGTSSTVVDILQDFIERAEKSKEEELSRKERMHREKLEAINKLVGIIKGTNDK